jgi:hypothetical protein
MGGYNSIAGGHNLYLGYNAGSGTYTLSGGTLATSGDEYVGYSGSGTFNQTGGTNTISGNFLLLAYNPGSNGAYTLSGTGTLSTAITEHIGYNGTGTFTQTGGTHTARNIYMGWNNGGAMGTYALSGGMVTLTQDMRVGNLGVGILNVSGTGVLTVGGTLVVVTGSSINLSGGTINTAALDTFGTPAGLNWTGGKLNITSDVIWDSAAAVESTSAAFGAARTLGNNQTLAVEGNETLGGAGAFALTLNSGGTHQVTGTLTVSPTGTLSQNSGSTLSAQTIKQSGGTVTGTMANQSSFVYESGTFSGRLLNQGSVTLSANSLTLGNGLQNDASITLDLNKTINANGAGLDNQGTFSLNAGMLGGMGPLVNNSILTGHGTIAGSGGFTNNGSVTVNGGTIILSNSGTNSNGSQVAVPAGQQMRLTGGNLANPGTIILDGGTISGTSTLNNTTGIISGHGTISSPLVNIGALVADGGILSVTSAFNNTGEVYLAGGVSNLSGSGAITNTGLIRGDGLVSKNVNNNAGGEIRAEIGKRIKLAGANGTNAGQINLQGGTAEFSLALTNGTSGQIAGRGTLKTGGVGLTNNGSIALASGITDVFGDVNNSTGSATKGITISGNADVTFWDDVTNGVGSLFKISAGSSATFFGAFGGAGISGTGSTFFEADITPGFSPAIASFEGNVALSSTANLKIEIGGLSVGGQFDQLSVTGDLALHGALIVSLINGFSPSAGQQFNILDWFGTRSGTFDSLVLQPVAGLAWNTSQLYTDGVLSVAAAPGLPGDFNNDGSVDAADYVVWRKGLGTVYNQNDFNVWRANFGATLGSGSATLSLSSAIPEPTSALLVLSFAAMGVWRHCGGSTDRSTRLRNRRSIRVHLVDRNGLRS